MMLWVGNFDYVLTELLSISFQGNFAAEDDEST